MSPHPWKVGPWFVFLPCTAAALSCLPAYPAPHGPPYVTAGYSVLGWNHPGFAGSTVRTLSGTCPFTESCVSSSAPPWEEGNWCLFLQGLPRVTWVLGTLTGRGHNGSLSLCYRVAARRVHTR